MSKFKLGDIVQVRGIMGPTMVVTMLKDGTYNCLWFDKDHRMCVIEFAECMLEIVSDTSKAVMQ